MSPVDVRERIEIYCFHDRPVYVVYVPFSHTKIYTAPIFISKHLMSFRLFLPLELLKEA